MLAAENLSIEKSLLFTAFSVRVPEYPAVGYSCSLVAAFLVEERVFFIRRYHLLIIVFCLLTKVFCILFAAACHFEQFVINLRF